MKKLILFVLFICSIYRIEAAHIVGGDIYYEYLGNNNYKVSIVIYRDCAASTTQFDSPLQLGIYTANNSLFQTISIENPLITDLQPVLNNPCVTLPSGSCLQRAIYETIVNLPPSAGGYTLAYQRCCRGPNVTNLNSPEDTGLTLETQIPGTNLGASNNSSPEFVNYPPLVICNNDILVFDHSATDLDGDNLSYELIRPNAGANDLDPAPAPSAYNPPFPLVNFAGGFTTLSPLGTTASISIDPISGVLTADPDLLGLFVVGIRVKEFRNGILIGQTDRDVLFRVVNCVIQLQAEVVPQLELPDYVSACQGFTVQFKNTSFGGSNYKWNFGDTTTTSDESALFEPAYTYPGPGSYTVSLIVNPGWPCTDTSFQTFTVNDSLDLNFTVEDSVCVTGNELDFFGTYSGPADPVINWDFSSHGSIQTSNQLNVFNVVFDTSGVIPVTLNITAGGCVGTKVEYVFLYNEPLVDFGIDSENKCAPYLAEFKDSSFSYAPLIYSWDFGDNTFSNLRNPAHVYVTPGTYSISLGIQSTEGCLATLSLTKPNLVTVNPSPISKFSVKPLETDIFNPDFQIFDESTDGEYLRYRYDDSLYSFIRNPNLSFVESGGHLIYQLVINDFSCVDSSFQIMRIIPQATVYVPNTFTPDGNKFNNLFQPIVFDVIEYKMEIFDKWGNSIFKSSDQKASWDGTFNGKNCQNGIYTYVLNYIEFGKQDLITKSGFVNLMR